MSLVQGHTISSMALNKDVELKCVVHKHTGRDIGTDYMCNFIFNQSFYYALEIKAYIVYNF